MTWRYSITLDIHRDEASTLHRGVADGLVAFPVLLLAFLVAVKAFLAILRAPRACLELGWGEINAGLATVVAAVLCGQYGASIKER